jgi:hypothetical protein
MRRSLLGITFAAAVVSTVNPVRAQTPSPAAAPPQWPWPQAASAAGVAQPYPFSAPTPQDAYRQGLINRWELERYEGPTPQALQGPSPDGGNQGGADRSD